MAPPTVTVSLLLLLLAPQLCQACVHECEDPGSVSLLCRTDEALRLRWRSVRGAASYSLQLQQRPQSTWTNLPETRTTTAEIANLTAATNYRLRVTPLPLLSEGRSADSAWLSTLPGDYVPGPAKDVKVTQTRGANATVDAVVSWTPPPELTCLYEVVLWSPSMLRVQQKELQVTEAPEVEFRALRFQTEYAVIVLSKSTNHSLESKATASFRVTDCLDWFNDTAICRQCLISPPSPVRLVADSRRRHKSVEVSWDVAVNRPLPSGFLVSLTTSRGAKVGSQRLPGWATNATFVDVDVDAMLLVTVQAQSPGGNSSSHVWTSVDDESAAAASEWLLLYVATPMLALGAASALLVSVLARRRRRRRRCRYFEELEKQSRGVLEPEAADQWEIAQERLLLGRVLGEGAFGVVQRGRLQQADSDWAVDVAVKMLRDHPTPEDVRQFEREIEMMKSVGPHPHIVSIVGCVTRSPRMRLVVEFCALGDLHNYLHNAWLQLNQMDESSQNAIQYAQLVSPKVPGECTRRTNLVINHAYDLQKPGVVCLKATDLLSFARQIAMGMEFLSNNHVLHRDLAARNVLVCDHRVVKISDFGLSRDVYEQNVYCTSGHGPLPVKWMALESLMHHVYTSQSDVWSFGVLLWEIVTLGANPYPSTPTGRVLKLLRTGYRMECPGNCSPQLYEIMLSCWKLKPRDRPTFSQLKNKLDMLLESSCPQQYLNLNVSLDTESPGAFGNRDTSLKSSSDGSANFGHCKAHNKGSC